MPYNVVASRTQDPSVHYQRTQVSDMYDLLGFKRDLYSINERRMRWSPSPLAQPDNQKVKRASASVIQGAQ